MKKDISSAFRTNLKKIMEERHLSTADLARIAGVNRNVIYYWLEGAQPRDLTPVSQLASTLNIPFHFLLMGKDEKLADRKTNGHTMVSSPNDLGPKTQVITLNGHFRVVIEKLD